MGGSWRLIEDPAGPAAWNMAVDEALLQMNIAGRSPPTLRLYGFSPPAVSVGYSQRISRAVQMESCERMGIQVVRRPTGGRAVLHDDEVTYSIIFPEGAVPAEYGRGVLAAYLWISSALLLGLRRLGIDAVLAKLGPGPGKGGSPACFDSASSYEISSKGMKIVGSAQVRREGHVLQHGSVLLTFDPGKAAACMFEEAKRRPLEAVLRSRAAGLLEVAPGPLEPTEVKEALKAGLAEGLGTSFVQGSLAEAEVALASRLEADKYSSRAWTCIR